MSRSQILPHMDTRTVAGRSSMRSELVPREGSIKKKKKGKGPMGKSVSVTVNCGLTHGKGSSPWPWASCSCTPVHGST